eukprot:gnl/Chilomastix_cuspidata/255.p2 GENE.gnl/Chilomastix_cuspidata/255~~gnl/Chilomastix_cuspidata/255.p2  ORF type:complete len:208 (+),score=38.44 gnl/Chilomastix_cuspidata/255:41-625(+)
MALGNPGPLGLICFGVTTTYLCFHFFDLYTDGNILYSAAFFFGGFLQVIAGIMEFFTGNTFGMTAFMSYGLFWISLKFGGYYNSVVSFSGSGSNLGWSFDFFFFIFTSLMSIGTILSKMNNLMILLFVDLALVFLILALETIFEPSSNFVPYLKATLGCICGINAMYIAMAEVVEIEVGREVFPLFKKRARSTA